MSLGTRRQLAPGSRSPTAAQRKRARAAQHSQQTSYHLQLSLCTEICFFFSLSPAEILSEHLPHAHTVQASPGRCWHIAAVRHCSRGGPSSFLVKQQIQVNSDSIFPPLLDKQNREMPLTRKRSSNHLVFARCSLPVTVETTPLPPTCCQCLDCSYLLLIELASPLLFCYPIQSCYILQTPCQSD